MTDRIYPSNACPAWCRGGPGDGGTFHNAAPVSLTLTGEDPGEMLVEPRAYIDEGGRTHSAVIDVPRGATMLAILTPTEAVRLAKMEAAITAVAAASNGSVEHLVTP
jgi:hypothetical protein